MAKSLEERRAAYERYAERQRLDTLAAIGEVHRVEAYCLEHDLRYYTLGHYVGVYVDLGLMPREACLERAWVVDHLRELRRVLGAPLRNVCEDASATYDDAKEVELAGGTNRSVHVKYHVPLLPTDRCRVVVRPADYTYRALVCDA